MARPISRSTAEPQPGSLVCPSAASISNATRLEIPRDATEDDLWPDDGQHSPNIRNGQDCVMPYNPPLAASGSREPKRAQAIPKRVKKMIECMVRGREDDPDAKPLDFIEAGRIAGLKPDVARRWLDRPHVISALRSERKAYREAICAGNEGALARVRDTSENGVAIVNSVRQLETMNEPRASDGVGLGRHPVTPGILVQINVNREPFAVRRRRHNRDHSDRRR
ncbi:MAG: hypothetical protein ACJ72H_00560 [Candidatus Sulfotelmatobacter sp.]